MRIPASRRVSFLGVMGWGDGDSQVCRRRRRRRTPPDGRWPRFRTIHSFPDGRWPRFRTIHSFPDGPFPGSPKAAQKAQKVRPLSRRFAPVGPKVRNVYVSKLILDQLMPLSCEIDEKAPLSSEITFATGHSPGLQKQPQRLQK